MQRITKISKVAINDCKEIIIDVIEYDESEEKSFLIGVISKGGILSYMWTKDEMLRFDKMSDAQRFCKRNRPDIIPVITQKNSFFPTKI